MPRKSLDNLGYTERTCKKCDETKHITEFEMNGKYRRHECVSCIRERNSKVVRDKEKTAERNRKYALKARFGITLEQYTEMLEEQNHCCAVCLRHKSEFKTNLAVDHNHETREIRGLLCTHCNHVIIGRNKNDELLRRAGDYLDKGTGLFVPDDVKPRRRYRRHKKKKTIEK